MDGWAFESESDAHGGDMSEDPELDRITAQDWGDDDLEEEEEGWDDEDWDDDDEDWDDEEDDEDWDEEDDEDWEESWEEDEVEDAWG